MLIFKVFILLFIFRAAQGLPILHTAETHKFDIDSHTVDISSHARSILNETNWKIIFVNETEYETFDFHGIKLPIFVKGNTTRFISKPFPITIKSEEMEQRYEIEGSTTLPYILEPKLPVSACIDSRYGSGGSISKSISFSFNTGISANIGLAQSILSFVNLGTSASISPSFSIEISISCSADAGESVQMFVAPWTIGANTRYREQISSPGSRKIILDWSDFFGSEWGVNVLPETYCLTSAEASCAMPNLDSSYFNIDRTVSV